MSQGGPMIRSISDTAQWVAVYRARETERSDALFRDPLAKRLAGERGEQMAKAMTFGEKASWAFVTRTYLVDQYIQEQVAQGVDLVVNLAAGLDARPYRMALPASLRWVEVDLPENIDYKEKILVGEKPVCALERVRMDLSNVEARRELFGRLGSQSKKALITCEGLLIYLTAEEVGVLALDLAAPPSFQHWIVDLASPGLLRMLQKNLGQLSEAGAVLKFGPPEGPGFFLKYGWKPVEVRSPLKTAAKFKRVPLWMRFFAMFPASNGPQGNRPWSGICLLGKQ